MPERTIIPNFLPQNGQFSFSAKEMNAIQRQRYQDDFGFYQRLFRLYTYMPMNSKRKFILHSPKGHPLMWQPYTSCSYSETGSVTIGRQELEPDPIYMKESFCHDVLMDSCYEHMIRYAASGEVDLDEEGQEIFRQFLEEVFVNAALGFRLTLTAGQLYDVDTVTFNDANTANITSLFKRTHGTARGWVKLAYDLAQGDYPWLDLNLTNDGDFNASGDFTGNIVELLDDLKANAKKEFKNQINRGGVITEGRNSFLPIIVLSDSYFNAVVDRYNTEGALTATNRVRLTTRTFGSENSATPNRVYYLDDRLPIIPLSDVNGFDPYISGATHFAGILSAGNVQMGTSFAGIPENVESDDIAVMVERENRISSDKYGRYTVLSHALVKTAIADPRYMVSTISYTE